MFKRTITALLSIFMLAAMTVAVSAAGIVYELTYDISSGGENEIVVKQGDTITVDFYMTRTDKQLPFYLRSYQNEIEYDHEFFELIIPSKWNFRYTPPTGFNVSDSRWSGQRIIKIAETNSAGIDFTSREWVGSFELKVIGEKGKSSYVTSSNEKASSADGVEANITPLDLKVTVAEMYDVTYSEQVFDSTETEKTAFRNIDYEGKILDSVYDELYLWTVSYEIGGLKKYVTAENGIFTIPGEDITGNIRLDYSKELNIKVYVEPYAPGLTLIRVEGAGEGYTFDGKRMIKAANSDNMGAWIVEGEISAEDAESMVGVAEAASDVITESTDITQDGTTSLNDLAIVLGCSEGYYESKTAEEVTHYLLSDINGDRQVTESDYTDIVIAYKQSKD